MKALANVTPVTHAIGNTMRRVVIMLICMAVFRTPVTPLGGIGAALAIGGSYVYAMTKLDEKLRAAEAAADAAGQPAREEAPPAPAAPPDFPADFVGGRPLLADDDADAAMDDVLRVLPLGVPAAVPFGLEACETAEACETESD